MRLPRPLLLLAVFSLSLSHTSALPVEEEEENLSHSVFLSHDGGVDDYLALLVLLTNSAAEEGEVNQPGAAVPVASARTASSWTLAGVAVTGADSFLDTATSASAKLLDLVYRSAEASEAVPATEGGDDASVSRPVRPFLFPIYGARAATSSFPDGWRRMGTGIDMLPQLNTQYFDQSGQLFPAGTLHGLDSYRTRVWQLPTTDAAGRTLLGGARLAAEADALFERLCLDTTQADRVWLETGPLTLLAEVLSRHPDAFGPPDQGFCFSKVFWMGGAVDTAGNVSPFVVTPVDGSAEWNSYWDPPAAAFVLDAASTARLPVFMVPLDVTNQQPVTRSFMLRLWRRAATGQSQTGTASFAAAAYSFAYRGTDNSYFMWDVLTAAAMMREDLMTWKKSRIGVVVDGEAAGRTLRCDGNLNDYSTRTMRCSDVYVLARVKDQASLEMFLLDSMSAVN
jgi:inosine-uridine nucleoside N-ribohydrolase